MKRQLKTVRNLRAFLTKERPWSARWKALCTSPIGANLVFKCGTSLSKAYHVIDRFSEDVDLTFDIRALFPDLVEGSGDAVPVSAS